MFTGIVEEIGTVRSVLSGNHSGAIQIEASLVTEGTRIGDSIAVNGVCLTVTDITENGFTADVMPETMNRTNLGSMKIGDQVNLERAMAADGRFGGHIVSGHIDGTGTVAQISKDEIAFRVRIKVSDEILRLIVEKGSICIDGVSLTVTEVDSNSFCVSLIPHTAKQTTLINKRVGQTVNLENDIIGKYVQRLINYNAPAPAKSSITVEFLAEHGFM